MNNTINIDFLRDLILSSLEKEEIKSVYEGVNIESTSDGIHFTRTLN